MERTGRLTMNTYGLLGDTRRLPTQIPTQNNRYAKLACARSCCSYSSAYVGGPSKAFHHHFFSSSPVCDVVYRYVNNPSKRAVLVQYHSSVLRRTGCGGSRTRDDILSTYGCAQKLIVIPDPIRGVVPIAISGITINFWAHPPTPPPRPGGRRRASRGTAPLLGRRLLTAHSDVQMCLSRIVSWIAMHTGFHFPLPSWS